MWGQYILPGSKFSILPLSWIFTCINLSLDRLLQKPLRPSRSQNPASSSPRNRVRSTTTSVRILHRLPSRCLATTQTRDQLLTQKPRKTNHSAAATVQHSKQSPESSCPQPHPVACPRPAASSAAYSSTAATQIMCNRGLDTVNGWPRWNQAVLFGWNLTGSSGTRWRERNCGSELGYGGDGIEPIVLSISNSDLVID